MPCDLAKPKSGRFGAVIAIAKLDYCWKNIQFQLFYKKSYIGGPGFKNAGTERVGDTVLLNSVAALKFEISLMDFVL